MWTNPDGFSWIEVLTDQDKVGCHVALTPTWSETACFADYVLPMGHGSERHDTHSYEQYDGQWIGFRQPVLRVAMERLGETITDTRQVNPGEVWEENEFWIELSWRIDPDGSMGIRQFFESPYRPGEKLTVDEYYGWMFENSVPGCPRRPPPRASPRWSTCAGTAPLRSLRGSGPPMTGSPGRRARRPCGLGRARTAFTAVADAGTPNVVPRSAPPKATGRGAARSA